MARLRNDNAAALIPDRTRELAEIADWYRRALADEPARRWNTGPTLIGPTWKRGADSVMTTASSEPPASGAPSTPSITCENANGVTWLVRGSSSDSTSFS